jgi:hypothetical protein
MSFKTMFEFGDNEVTGNAQCFATYTEAYDSAAARFALWTVPTGYRVNKSEDPVNYVRINGEDKHI